MKRGGGENRKSKYSNSMCNLKRGGGKKEKTTQFPDWDLYWKGSNGKKEIYHRIREREGGKETRKRDEKFGNYIEL